MENIEFNKVTWYSKLGAFIVLVVIVPALAFFIGMKYGLLKAQYPSSDISLTSSVASTTSTPQIISFNASDTGKMLSVSSGEIIQITLPNPADGGYAFDNPEFDTSLLHLNTHFSNPATNNTPGSAGSDIWQFAALKQGVTDITIIAGRTGGNKEVVFRASFGIQ